MKTLKCPIIDIIVVYKLVDYMLDLIVEMGIKFLNKSGSINVIVLSLSLVARSVYLETLNWMPLPLMVT